MNAATDTSDSDTSAAPQVAALRGDLFDVLTAGKGAITDVQRARLLGVDRRTIQRMRDHTFAPRLALAMRMAEALDTTVEALFELAATP